MKRAMLVVGLLILSLGATASAMAMGGMTMPASTTQAKLDAKQIDSLFETAFGGLNFTEDQAMKAHDIVMNMIGPMDELMKQIDAAQGAEKDLKSQEMMLLMQRAQVELDGAVQETQMHVLNGLIFGEFPGTGAHPADAAQAGRLKAAEELRAAMDDHEIARRIVDILAKMMSSMPGMSDPHMSGMH